ncbi:MAG: hypothetical protein M1817_003703 [Caeruleum heppii]|nr:MAG: hypothetical protein M1817_003703 [Caeruleum heppii]
MTRPGKRFLIRWNDELNNRLLLCIQYACNEKGMKLPWELIAKHLDPRVSEGAIVQHLAKLRNRLEGEGVEVPPPLRRGGMPGVGVRKGGPLASGRANQDTETMESDGNAGENGTKSAKKSAGIKDDDYEPQPKKRKRLTRGNRGSKKAQDAVDSDDAVESDSSDDNKNVAKNAPFMKFVDSDGEDSGDQLADSKSLMVTLKLGKGYTSEKWPQGLGKWPCALPEQTTEPPRSQDQILVENNVPAGYGDGLMLYGGNFEGDDMIPRTPSLTQSTGFSDLHRSSISSYQNLDYATYDYGVGQFSNRYQKTLDDSHRTEFAHAGQFELTTTGNEQPIGGGSSAVFDPGNEVVGAHMFQGYADGEDHFVNAMGPPHAGFQDCNEVTKAGPTPALANQLGPFDNMPTMPPLSFDDICHLSPIIEGDTEWHGSYDANAGPTGGLP